MPARRGSDGTVLEAGSRGATVSGAHAAAPGSIARNRVVGEHDEAVERCRQGALPRAGRYTGSTVVCFTRCNAKLDLMSATLGCFSNLSMMKREKCSRSSTCTRSR